MQKITFFSFSILWFCSVATHAQDFLGYRSSAYTGVNGVFFNPANIADNRFKWDVNLFSVSTFVGSNQASYSIKDLGEGFGDKLESNLWGEGTDLSSAMVNLNIHGPSFMFSTVKKSSFAVTSRARIMVNAVDIDGGFAKSLIDDAGDLTLPYSLNTMANMRVATHGWSELGLSYARILKEDNAHFLKGGFTVKYLGGAANGYLAIDQLRGTLDEATTDNLGTYLTNASGRVAMGVAGLNFNDLAANDLLSFSNAGVGADVGLVYEYRPDYANYKTEVGKYRRDVNKYKLRLGISLLDVGSISYNRDMDRSGEYTVGISNAQRFYLSAFDGKELEDVKSVLNQYPQFFTPGASQNKERYSVSLPTTLQMDADYHVKGGFSLNLAGQFSLAKPASKLFNTQYYSFFSLTPRIESRGFGIYFPLSVNSLTHFNAGVSLRLGPLFVGTGSGLTALLGDSRQADVHVGLRFGGLYKKVGK